MSARENISLIRSSWSRRSRKRFDQAGCRAYDIIVLEGAGSPAEINLQEGDDLVNMGMAKMAQCPGASGRATSTGAACSPSLWGRCMLLEPEEREMVKGLDHQ